MVMSQGRIVVKGRSARFSLPAFIPTREALLRSVPQLRTDWLTDILAGREDGRLDGDIPRSCRARSVCIGKRGARADQEAARRGVT